MSRLHRTRCLTIAACIGVLWLSGCLPSRSAFLRLEVKVEEPLSGDHGTVRIELSEVLERMDSFDPDDAAYYFRGRQPLAHRYEDTDGDGEPDAVLVDLPLDATEHWVVIVSPK